MTWDEIKKMGSSHYKTGTIEPIDLYRDSGALRDFALCSIIKYAYRNIDNRASASPVKDKDMDKICHYASMLKVACGEGL